MRQNPYVNTPFDLTDQVVLITGASGGLGQRFATTLALAGAKLVIAARDRDSEQLQALENVLYQQVGVAADVLRVGIDVTSEASIQAGMQVALAHFGEVNVLINNAGVAAPAAAAQVGEQQWSQLIDVNLKGAWLMAREFTLPRIESKQAGVIVNISSILSRRVAGGLMTYAVAKAGLEQMTNALALEWARYQIRVNALAPGYILTDLNRAHFESEAGEKMIAKIPQRRIGEPADLDGALLLLSSPASAYMTGSSLVVDGGHLHSSL